MTQDWSQPDQKKFDADPIGYSAFAWHRWGMVQTMVGGDVDISKAPTAEDLKSPVLWLTQAHALSEAARVVLQTDLAFESMPLPVRGMCDSQYRAVGLMLVGYSLEVCLKAMLILKKGVNAYLQDEKSYRHHDLVELAGFIDWLSDKDKAILKALTHFTTWAGRYPDPGSRFLDDAEEIFTLAEGHQISARDLFTLAGRVMAHASKVIAASATR